MSRVADRILGSSPKSYGMYAKALRHPEPSSLIHLELGSPVHDTPQHIKDATLEALQDGRVHYSDFAGIAPLREALAAKLIRFNRIQAGPNTVLVTNGLTQASFATFMALINPGDEVILLAPYYPQHINKIELAGGRIVFAPLDAQDNFSIRADWIAERVTPRTKAIVLVNPCNPTGRVYTHAELTSLAQIAIAHDLIVISDEVYEYVTFGPQHISIASLPGMADRTVSMFAFTKAYAMDGWRIGYLTAAPDLLDAIMKVAANEVTHVNTFIQYGALAAVLGPPEAVADMIADDRAKRDYLVSALNQMPGLSCRPPEGTIYVFPDIRGTGLSSATLADRILDEAKVVVEAGDFYGPYGEGYLRVCFGSQPMNRLEDAVSRLSRVFSAL
jgi:aspartate aminotransferase